MNKSSKQSPTGGLLPFARSPRKVKGSTNGVNPQLPTNGDAGMTMLQTDLTNGGAAITAAKLMKQHQQAFGNTATIAFKDATDTLEFAVNDVIAKSPVRFDPTVGPARAPKVVEELASIVAKMPTQNRRDEETDALQQFSTPPHYAYVVAWVANLKPQDVVLEPSAGVGGLCCFSLHVGCTVFANEISEKRRVLLESLIVPDRLFCENAEQLHNILPAKVRPTVVLMNPPFSVSVRMSGSVPAAACLHIDQALKRLEPGGRLVAIVGRGMAPDRDRFIGWWANIKKHFTVRANVGIPGKEYRKFGTTFDTRLIVIDKPLSGEAPETVEPVVADAESVAAAIPLLKAVREARPRPDVPPPPVMGDLFGAAAPIADPKPRTATPSVSASQEPALRSIVADEVKIAACAAVVNVSPLKADAIYEAYHPQRLHVAGALPHPTPLVESVAMASVLPPEPTYAPALPFDLIASGTLSEAQLEAIVYAGQAHRQFLETFTHPQTGLPVSWRKGFMVGDGTGVGKGRECCGIILDNFARGGRKAVWVSATGRLLKDAIRDWTDLGGRKDEIINLSKIPAGNAIVASRGILFTTYDTLKAEAKRKNASDPPITRLQQIVDWLNDGAVPEKEEYPAWLAKDLPLNARLRAVIENPCSDTWDAAHGIELAKIHRELPPRRTFWQRVIEIDRSFPSQGPSLGEPWARVPDLTVLRIALGLPPKPVFESKFDGVIAFDESHKMKSAFEKKTARGRSKVSQRAITGGDLQAAVPKARIVYFSATGATEVSNLAYGDRLGLWGRGTAFPTKAAFISQIESGGVAAMELVSRDMKQMGVYIARGLSFDGVDYDRIVHALDDHQRETYDKLCEAWQIVLRNFKEALELVASKSNGGIDGKAKSAAMSAFWSAHQRFFNQVLTAMQMPSVITDMEKQLEAGHACVLQLVTTNEAPMDRQLAKLDEESDLSDIDLTPKDQLVQLVQHCFPVVQLEEYEDDGKLKMRPVEDSKGNLVLNQEALAMREKLVEEVASIRCPDAPLEMVINHFGVDNVGEVTGRKRRVVRKPDGNTVIEPRSPMRCMADAADFQDDKRRVLIFSDAGGTGASYHASTKVKNQRRRYHYLIQAGWVADAAVQGFGRTHRSDQAQPPFYLLASTDLKGQKRFISTIARRLDQLGALTKGQRQAATQGLFKASDNLESEYAKDALYTLYQDIHAGKVEGISLKTFTDQTGLEITDDEGNLAEELPPVTRFLNRLLSMKIAEQNQLFDAYSDRIERRIAKAIEDGTFDVGVETIVADKAIKVSEQTVYTHPASGAQTKHVVLTLHYRRNATTFDAVMEQKEATNYRKLRCFAKNVRSGKISAFAEANDRTMPSGQIVSHLWQITPLSRIAIPESELRHADPKWVLDRYGTKKYDGETLRWEIVPNEQAQAAWDAQVAALPEFIEERLDLITGAVLPIWDRLKGNPKVKRLQTDEGEKLLGRVIAEDDVHDTLRRLGVEARAPEWKPQQIVARLEKKSHRFNLVNGWQLRGAMYLGQKRYELVGPDYRDHGALKMEGVTWERVEYKMRYWIPTDTAAEVIGNILKFKPVLSVQKEGE